MAATVKSIYDIFDSKAIAAYWEDVNPNMQDPLIGTQFFPNDKKYGLELSWIKGKNGLPVVLQPSAFDTKASLRDRVGVSELSTEMPFFREGMRIGEKDRQDLMTLLAKGEQFVEPTIRRLFDDVGQLISGAEVQAERMRMQLLATGKISVAASKGTGRTAAYDYNFDPDSSWADDHTLTLTSTATWEEANADTMNPVLDIMDVKKTMREMGKNVTRALMNSTTLNNMLLSTKVSKAMNPVGYANMINTDEDIQRYIERKTGIQFIIYDKMFINEEGESVKFFPDNKVTFLPSTTVGTTWYGTTPEEYDLLSGNTNASVSIVGSGIAITSIKEPHPVNVFNLVSAIMLPSFERMDDVFVLTTK